MSEKELDLEDQEKELKYISEEIEGVESTILRLQQKSRDTDYEKQRLRNLRQRLREECQKYIDIHNRPD